MKYTNFFSHSLSDRVMDNSLLGDVLPWQSASLFKFFRRMIICCAFVVIAVPFEAFSQTPQNVLTGRVVSKSGKGISDVNIFASYPENKYRVFAHSISESDGSFRLTISAPTDSILINVTGVAITPKSILLPNQSANRNIIVEEKVQELQEVVVRAKKIYSQGDTINYSVQPFQLKTDITIGQVLQRIPGVSVSETGQISYKGQPIKKFYIEGLDLMKGRYGIATNSIDPNSIGTIQLLENHQDIEALKGLMPEERASINLKLKSGVKGVFNLIATLGGGYDKNILWENELIATYFKRSSQLLSTYKGNNSGVDLERELRSFDNNDFPKTSALTDISIPAPPNIKKKDYFMNKSHIGTYNHIFRIGQKGELGFNVAYLNSHENRDRHSVISNRLPDESIVQLDELFSGKTHHEMLYGIATYIQNSKSTYVKEQLKFDYSLKNGQGDIFAGKNISQSNRNENYKLNNNFHLVKRTASEGGIELYSKTYLEKRPHCLRVTPNLFTDFLTEQFMYQEAESKHFSMENKLGFLSALVWGKLKINPFLHLDYQHDGLKTTLESFQNDLNFGKLNGGVGLDFSLKLKRFYAHLSLITDYIHINLIDVGENRQTSKQRVAVVPSLSARYDFNGSNELKFNGHWGYSYPGIESLFHQYILTSYRQLTAYDHISLHESRTQSYSLSFDHKNIASMLFLGGGISWINERPEVLYGSYFDGILERTTNQKTNEQINILAANLRASQSYYWKRLKIGLEGRISQMSTPFLRQNQVIRYLGKSLNLNWDISLAPIDWLFVSYDGKYSLSSGKVEGGSPMTPLHCMGNSMAIDFSLPHDITLGTSFSHFYNSYNQVHKNFILGDLYAKYSYKKWMLTLSLGNLFNQQSYIYGTSSALTESRYNYQIRPRSVLLKLRYRII